MYNKLCNSLTIHNVTKYFLRFYTSSKSHVVNVTIRDSIIHESVTIYNSIIPLIIFIHKLVNICFY